MISSDVVYYGDVLNGDGLFPEGAVRGGFAGAAGYSDDHQDY